MRAVRLRLGNLFVRPGTRVLSLERRAGRQTIHLQVEGMVCDI